MLMAKEQYDTYDREPTGSSLSGDSISDFHFPAITICDNHFENARAYEELGFPVSPLNGKPKEITNHPLKFYEELTDFDLPVMPQLWEYYFTLDRKIFDRTKYYGNNAYFFKVANNDCRVGLISCGILLHKRTDRVVPDGDQEIMEVDVPAGKWVSKFLADSTDGTNQLCHTLIPNVTVTFENPYGHSIALRWKNVFVSKSNFWKVYVHDTREHVLLDSYAIKTMPSVTILKHDSEDMIKIKRKVLLLPRLTKHPSSSEILPCASQPDYSENWCNIQWGWQERLEEMTRYYGSNFTCRLPGIWANMNAEVPICSHYDASTQNGALGFQSLMTAPIFGMKRIMSVNMHLKRVTFTFLTLSTSFS